MGAETFETIARGKTAKDAFTAARKKAQYDRGHAGYTGTIAEKCDFVMIPVPAPTDPRDYARALLNSDDSRISDKWGPAGCITLSKNKYQFGENEYLFFGWASC